MKKLYFLFTKTNQGVGRNLGRKALKDPILSMAVGMASNFGHRSRRSKINDRHFSVFAQIGRKSFNDLRTFLKD